MPQTWSADEVEIAMIDAFRRALVTTSIVAVFADRGFLTPAGKVDAPSLQHVAASLDVLNWPTRFVADRRNRRWLMIRVSDKARRRDGIAEVCREFGVVRSTFDRACERSLRDIAVKLNEGDKLAA